MCGAAGAARSAKSCSRSGLRLLGLLADTDQFGARRLRKYKAIRGNRLIEGGLYDRNLQLIVVAGAGDVDLPGIVKLAERVPVAVTIIGGQHAAGSIRFDPGDIQVGSIEPDFLRDFELVGWRLIRVRSIGVRG